MYLQAYFLVFSFTHAVLSNVLNASIEEEGNNNENSSYSSIYEIFMKNPDFNIYNIKLMTNTSHEENIAITSKNVIFRF